MFPLDPGLTCVTLLAVLPLLATVWAIVRRGRSGWGILALAGGLTAAVAVLAIAMLPLPVNWSASMSLVPGTSIESPPRWMLQVRLDSAVGVMLAALGLAVATLSASARTATGLSRTIALGMFTVAVWYWLIDTVWLALILQAVLLALGFLLIAAQPTWPTGGPAARMLWLTVTCTDVALLLVASGWTLESGAANFSDAGSEAAVAQVASRAAAAVSALGTLLWLGTLGRMLQFPFGMACDQARQPAGLTMGAVTSLALGSVGWRWLAAGQLWFLSSPQTRNLVSAGAALGGVVAAWFAICSSDPRTRVAWLTTVPWSFAAATLLADDSAGSWTSLLIGVTGLLASAWLYGLWESDEADAAAEAAPGETPSVFTFTSFSGGRVVSGQFAGQAQQIFRLFTGERDATATTSVATARGGRLAVLLGCVGLLLAPVLLGQGGDRLDSVVVTTASLDDTVAAVETSNSVARPQWPGWARLVVLGLAALAATLLIAETRPSPESRFPMWLVAGGGVVLFVPWILFGASAFEEPRLRLMAESGSLGSSLIAVVVGVLAGVWESRRSLEAPRRGWLAPWSRLGQRRLYLHQIVFFGVNLPIRGLAQLTRFLEWFLWDAVALGILGKLPRLGADAEIDLHRSEPGFYALSLCLGATMVAFTLMWLSQ